MIRPRALGGLAHDAQWSNDFHHALHALLTGERQGYYADFGRPEDVAKGYQDGYVLTGQYSIYRDRRHGAPTDGIPAERFVVFSQNHDQVGNRVLGDRLSCLVSFEQLKVAAGLVLLSPFVPLLFMGEEYGETAPFLYFISHSDPALVEAVRRGRKEAFAAFAWHGEPPDPQDEQTFDRSRLNHDLAEAGHHRALRDFYRELLHLRRDTPALARLSREGVREAGPSWSELAPHLFLVHRSSDADWVSVTFNLSPEQAEVSMGSERGRGHVLIDSADERWGGLGTLNPSVIEPAKKTKLRYRPWSFMALHHRRNEETRG